MRVASALDDVDTAPGGVTVTAAAVRMAALLPLLAAPFLPPPLAVLVALCSLATPVRAWWSDCSKLTHAACAVYNYNNETGTIDRGHPIPILHAKCEHPLQHAETYRRAVLHAQEHGRRDDPLLVYCSVHALEFPFSILPWLNDWLTHLPVADPAAVAASGDRVCYVELTHLAYTEGYYIRCPGRYSEGQVSICLQEPEEEIVAAVWEHRRLNSTTVTPSGRGTRR